MIELADDFRDLLIELAEAGAEFVIVGGYAVAFYGHPRATKDIDLLVRATPSNAQKVYRALAAYGAPLQAFEVTEADFSGYEGVLQIGIPPRRIDILNRVSGVTFDEATSEVGTFDIEGRHVIGLKALLKNKGTAGREQDLADVAALTRKHRIEYGS